MGLEMKYFVLKPRAKHRDDVFARASQRAMQTYADYIRSSGGVELSLANELHEWANREHIRQLAQHDHPNERSDEAPEPE